VLLLGPSFGYQNITEQSEYEGNETQVEAMRAGLAIIQEAEDWLRAGEGNEQLGDTGKTHTVCTLDVETKTELVF